MPSPQAYSRPVRKLVLGIDVGTTYSSMAYALLDPGEVPNIHGVTRFPRQENAAGDWKIPSILCYRQDGSVHSVGAEAAPPGLDLEAEYQDLVLVERFKLHLRPERLGDFRRQELPPLPRGKTNLDVFSDFLRYLFRCAGQYIRETHANGESLWASIEDRIEFVLSHPNGWERLQQGKMRQAAIMAGLVPDTAAGHARVHLVTEGEASLMFCIQSGLTEEAMQISDRATVKFSTYAFASIFPLARKFLEERLASSAYGNDKDINSVMCYFDNKTKPAFEDDKKPSYIKFGSMSCNDPKVNIRRGQLMLSGAEMSSFFQPSLDAIVDVVQKQRREVAGSLETVCLVGGFAASPWLHTALKSALNAHGVTLCHPDSLRSKVVANGTVYFYFEQFVSARIMNMTYDTNVAVDYDSSDPERYRRRDDSFVRPSGRIMLRHGFSTILKKSYVNLDSIVVDVLCYRGRSAQPKWVDNYTPICTVSADTSRVSKQKFKIVLLCSSTELRAQIGWVDGISYDDDLDISQ
ncbi:hypothetical protein BD311DRAFT_778837 [Dichomitus squalens]|uniref:Actin-like ATPase domain-containing protein n=1 Tax=Dichomitus squalens TaxID=114155 RepID=A0A4Q9MJP1_9APHY|nr:hypothetical protein BD311DRAFT_778837 [Dichomitus squalens]